jgi:hypothetical protein
VIAGRRGKPQPETSSRQPCSPRTEPGTTGWGASRSGAGAGITTRSPGGVRGPNSDGINREPAPGDLTEDGGLPPNHGATKLRRHLDSDMLKLSSSRVGHLSVRSYSAVPAVPGQADITRRKRGLSQIPASRCNSCPPLCLGTSQTPRRRIPAEKAHGGRSRLWSARSHAAPSSCCSRGGVCGAGVMGTPGAESRVGNQDHTTPEESDQTRRPALTRRDCLVWLSNDTPGFLQPPEGRT